MAIWHDGNNCYSYAIDDPTDWHLIRTVYDESVDYLLDNHSNLRLVSREDLVLGKEYIAYRYGNRDFHFMKRNKMGYWRHKMGCCPVEAISTKFVLGKEWVFRGGNVYNSKLYLFEVLQ